MDRTVLTDKKSPTAPSSNNSRSCGIPENKAVFDLCIFPHPHHNLVTGMHKMSRNHCPEENKTLHQAPEGLRTRYRNETARK